MNEYDCWLQAGHMIPQNISAQTLSRLYAPNTGIIIDNATAEYVRLMHKMFGLDVTRVTDATSPCVTIAFADEATGKTGGFTLRVSDSGISIVGADETGALYGVYRFFALLALGKLHYKLEITDAPVSAIRMINHWDNIDGTIERGYAGRSLFFADNRIVYDKERVTDYARLLASIGINRLSINNVNVRGDAKRLITDDFLPDVAALAALFRPFGIRLLLSINFAAPYTVGGLDTADPRDKRVAAWWQKQADVVYRYVPDLAGFLVKADAEGEPGPYQYGRNHADGANMLAAALRPHGGEVVWRCFVYNSAQDWRDTTVDRARAAYDTFYPLDGCFDDNVLLQIKHGPYDFQVREPVSPLFGALKRTRQLMELQITQEYTGHQIDLCYLPYMWQDVLNFDTAHGDVKRIKDLLTSGKIGGLAAVGNVGLDQNWTGHTLAQANFYGYGRLAWNPALTAADIASEWARLTFPVQPANNVKVDSTVANLLLRSYPAYEKYNAPFGVCFMVTPGDHYGPNIEGYEFSRWGTYHRADREAIGIDRTPSGTGYTTQYARPNAMRFADIHTCPENLLLFFHRVRYDYCMQNGETLLQNIYDTHFEGVENVEKMLALWDGLRAELDAAVYESVKNRMEKQLVNAREWRDQINTYFFRKTGIADKRGRKIYG
jgi:alpha-glucuronidase